MTEKQFRAALGQQVDRHVRRLEIAYGLLFHTAGALMRQANRDGVDQAALARIVDEENARAERALDGILAASHANAAQRPN